MRIRLIRACPHGLIVLRVVLRVVDAMLLAMIRPIVHVHRILHLVIRARIRDQLLAVRVSVLAGALVVISSTAADSEDPEEARGDAKSYSEPCDCEEMRVHGGFDAVGFGGGFDSADSDR